MLAFVRMLMNCPLRYWMQNDITNHSNYNRSNPLCLNRGNIFLLGSIPQAKFGHTNRKQLRSKNKIYWNRSQQYLLIARCIYYCNHGRTKSVLIPMGTSSRIPPAPCDIIQIHLYCSTCIQHNHPSLSYTSDEDLSACNKQCLGFSTVTKHNFLTVHACLVQVLR